MKTNILSLMKLFRIQSKEDSNQRRKLITVVGQIRILKRQKREKGTKDKKDNKNQKKKE